MFFHARSENLKTKMILSEIVDAYKMAQNQHHFVYFLDIEIMNCCLSGPGIIGYFTKTNFKQSAKPCLFKMIAKEDNLLISSNKLLYQQLVTLTIHGRKS